jgi:phosphoglycerol transferase
LLLNILLTFYINLPSIIDGAKNNFESFLPSRSGISSNIYGLKLVNLFLPIENHFLKYFSNLKIFFNDVIDIEQENRAVSLGLLQASGLLFSLLWLLLRNNDVESLYTKTVKKFFLKDKDCEKISFLASLNLLAILFFSAGGGFLMFFSVIFPVLRSNARCVVFIAFFSLTIMALIFDKIIAHKFFKNTLNAKIFIIIIAVLALFDQVGRVSSSKLQSLEVVTNFNNDKDFIEQIEKSLAKNSAIFILPIYSFPESRGDYYRGLIAYLHAKNLRFSYPVNRASKSFIWQKKIFMNLSFKNFINELKKKGFAGIYLDRDEYITFFNINKGRIIDRNILENEMKKYSISSPIYSNDKTLMFVKI